MKKVVIVTAILLCSLAITAVVFAQQLEVEPEPRCLFGWGRGCIIPPEPIPPWPPKPPQPDIQIARGIAVKKYSLTTEPVIFVTMRYHWRTYNYLMIDGQLYTMEQIYSKYDWRTGTRIFKYRANDWSVMTLVAQEFDGIVSVSADFGNYMITFEPIRTHGVRPVPEPIYRETEVVPLFKTISQEMGKVAGMDVESALKQAKPIAEWTE